MNKLIIGLVLIFSLNVYSNDRQTFIIEFHERPLAIDYGQKLKSFEAIDGKSLLAKKHQEFIDELSSNFKQSPQSFNNMHEYFFAFNGMSLSLTKNQARYLKKHPDVKSIALERHYKINTDVGPQWIGADAVWEGLALDTPGNKGEGIVIGIIDTGINPSHPSFQSVSQAGTPDEYSHTNPKGRTFGQCTPQTCNNKLIGIYDFTTEGTGGIDSVGHGSHVAGIAAGNPYTTNHLGLDFTVSGVAPRANIISYKACFFSEDAAGGSCSSSALLASIDQATQNQVDVVNYSIGSELPCSPWGGIDNNGSWCGTFGVGQAANAMLNARSAGVLFVVSAGNNGPGPTTVGYPAIAPWVIAAANTTHSRQLQSSVVDFSGGGSTLEDLVGASATDGIGPLKIVHARDYGNALCGQGDPELKSQCSGSGNDVLTGVSNPFATNTFNGEIVVCDRGSYGRVEKGFNVMQAGAAGYILANTTGQQESIVADNHCLPSTHLGNIDGTKIRDWLASGSNHMGTITGQTLVYDGVLGDVMNSSSSRGPTTIVYNSTSSSTPIKRPQNYMKPNLSAPGTSIFAATQEGTGITSKSGTSMASPHIAGAVALVKAAHPNYTPSQLVSSLVLTADNTHMLKEDKTTKAEFSDQGAGRTRVDRAIGNSLYFDINRQEFIDANPQNGADISQLNLPELVNDDCYPSCSFNRTVKLLSSYNVVNPVWDVTVEQTNGLIITVTPASFDFNSTNEVSLAIDVDTTANDVIGDWAEAKIVFTVKSSTNSDPLLDSLSPSPSKLPLAVFVPAGNYPAIVEKQTTTRHGRFPIELNNIASMTDASYSGLGLKVPDFDEVTLTVDANSNPFNDDGEYDETGSYFNLFEVTSNKVAIIIESNSTGVSGADLYVGQDLNINDTPDEYEIKCQKSSSAQNKRCVLKDVKPGKYWILVNNKSNNRTATVSTELIQFSLNDTPRKAAFDLGSGVTKGTGLYIKSAVKVNTSTTLDISYELPLEYSPINNYYGIIAVGADSDSIGKTEIIPIKITADEPTNEKLYSLNNEVAEFNYTRNEILSNMYIDTGINATSINIQSYSAPYKVNFYRTGFDFDPLNIKPDLSSMIPDFSLDSTAIFSQKTSPQPPPTLNLAEIDISEFAPGRWYVEVEPTFIDPLLVSMGYFPMNAEVTYATDGLIQPFQSLWYNSERSGWGIDLIQTLTYQAITWYRYNQDGTQPIWMQAAGRISAQNQWTGDLNLITYNGQDPRVSYFGSISIVYTAENKGVISISMPDKTYTEPLSALYSPNTNCPQVNGSELLDITGLWYLPEQSGFGNTVLATETAETTVFYFYDDLGMPVWTIGDRVFANNETVMKQVSNGFCPDCQSTSINLEPVGTLINQYNSNSSGSTVTDIQLIPPLSGHWQTTGESQKLNSNFGCQINP